jgi:outer membrane receptor for ferrienterochelin and colicins
VQLNRILVFFIGIFSFLNASSQQFEIRHTRSNEPIEGVNSVFFINDKPIEFVRSNFKGEIYFKNFKGWDSVIFFKLGMKRVLVTRTTFNSRIQMEPNQNIMDEVIITGQIVPGNRYQSPFKIKYFTAEEIKNKNAVSLADFLQTENNFTVTQDPILGTKVSLNGMSGSDLKLMIDGIPVAGRLNGNIDYSQIILSNYDRIEFVDGPMSTIYGTNATAGVINLITKTGTLYESNVQANLYAESVGVLNLNAYYNTTKNGHRVSLGVHRNVFLGWDQHADSLKSTIKPLWRDMAWNPKEQVMVNTSYYAPISKKTNLHFKVNGFWETITNKLNPSSSQQVLVNDEYYKTVKFNIGGNTNSILSKAIEWQNYSNINYFGRNTDYYNQNLVSGSEYFLKTVKEEILNVFGRTQFKHELAKSEVKLLYGADYNMDVGFSQKLDSNASSVRDLSLFIMCNTKIGKKILMQPGLRYSFNNISPTPISHTINFRYELSKHFSSRFSYSRGYRIPELKELYFTFVDINHNISGNPNLKTELNDNFQLGIDVLPAKDKDKTRVISYSSSLNFTYFNKSDAIDIVNINSAKNEFQYLNIGNFKGLVGNIDNRIKYKDFLVVFGTSMNGYQRFFTNSSNQLDQWLFNWTINGNLTYMYKKWNVKFTSLNKLNSTNDFVVYNLQSNKVEESSIPAYMYTDINASKSFYKNKLNITFGIKNLWNVQNLRVQGYSGNVHSAANSEVNNLWGRTLFTNITLNIDNVK